MKKLTRTMIAVMAVAGLLFTTAALATAAAKTSEKDVNKLSAQIAMLNAEAKLPQADQVIMKQLKDTFSVGSDKISSLLGKNMQYGEIATVLAFADKMPGGITDANINQVLNLHQSSTGWGPVAKNVNVDIGTVASKLSSLEDDAHKNIKQALAQMPAASSAAGGVSQSSGQMGGQMNEPMGGTGGSSGEMGGATGGTGTTGGMSGGAAGGTQPDTGTYGGATGGTGTTEGTSGGATGGTGTSGY